MRRTAAAPLLYACALVLLAACGGAEEEPVATAGEDTAAGAGSEAADDGLEVTLVDPEGTEVGTVSLAETDEGTEVTVEVDGLPPGFHAFHVHSIGACEPDSVSPTDPAMTGDFLSAGGHLGAGEADHGEHQGDLPTLFVSASGTGSLTAVTDALSLADLTDQDGSAVMVHAGRDNYANIPERYAPGGPDDMTKGTGDAGGRIACGLVEG
ncbi:superoxide dismutase family protein [Modestobacter marinus]|uniref:superoxide dismutase family protein n=1 Tax=Modestobacter marinus TaxID=477641 RepID=UPI001C955EE7|nr:superoxide dismutase family protein [Modestobacter marinus]